jgi:hypothetical protein
MTVQIFDVRFEKQDMSRRQANWSTAHNGTSQTARCGQPTGWTILLCQQRQITRTAFQHAKTEAWLLKKPASVNARCVIVLAGW